MSAPSPASEADGSLRRSWPRRLLVLIGLTLFYITAGKLGLKLAVINPSASAVWPPTGIALAAFLLLGYGAWPAVLVGAFVVNVTTAGGVAASIGIAIGNTLEGIVGAWLLRRFANGPYVFDDGRGVFKFVLLAGMLSTALSATIGVTTLALAGLAPWTQYAAVWKVWWLGDAVGDLVVAPVLVLWFVGARLPWTRTRILEAGALVVSLILVALAVFDGAVLPWAARYPLEFICLPLFVWGAFRLAQREAVLPVLLVSAIAVWGTLDQSGPFARTDPNVSLVLLQAFMGVTAVMTLALAAVVTERRRVEGRLRELAVKDPMTGIGNYRHMLEVLAIEMERSGRTGRPFSLLFLDMDQLKRVNDKHGHLVGSRALCRVAEVLDRCSRQIDTAARFGGDEFVLVLPESDEAAAQHVADRVAKLLAAQTETPSISASVGIAVYPRDGDTVDKLLAAADRRLYRAKAVTHGEAKHG